MATKPFVYDGLSYNEDVVNITYVSAGLEQLHLWMPSLFTAIFFKHYVTFGIVFVAVYLFISAFRCCSRGVQDYAVLEHDIDRAMATGQYLDDLGCTKSHQS